MEGISYCGKEQITRMRKKAKQYIRKSLCGILSAAMILTSLSVPELTTYAAQPDMTDGTEVSEEEVTDGEKSENDSLKKETDQEDGELSKTVELSKEDVETEASETEAS